MSKRLNVALASADDSGAMRFSGRAVALGVAVVAARIEALPKTLCLLLLLHELELFALALLPFAFLLVRVLDAVALA